MIAFFKYFDIGLYEHKHATNIPGDVMNSNFLLGKLPKSLGSTP
jgi:hypothetical protein